ncbi:MAG TPA: enoyl-CoA hydratase/isomerase family protein, partial [Acidimicrobiales bacterium]|nr:enoyl-CoA hydratase/isomerase family protein [Acidimicrobiales bacterium]
RGRALGFGSGLVLHCDLAVAGDTAVFGFNEIAHGFPPLIVESYLARYVGEKAALDLVLTGRPVPAWEARSLGMIARVVPDDQLDAAGAALVERLAGLDQRALRAAKSFLRDVVDVPAEERPTYGLEELLRWRGFGNDE